MMNTLYMAYSDPWYKVFNLIHGMANGALGPSLLFNKYIETSLGGDDLPKSGTKIMEEHNATVRKLAPAERFLEFDVKEGWATLCQFLGKEVPETDFPRLNDVQNYRNWWTTCTVRLITAISHECTAMLEGINAEMKPNSEDFFKPL
jgi:hypothetical protein